jgi:hypothetical protein
MNLTGQDIFSGLLELMQVGRVRAFLFRDGVPHFVLIEYWKPEYSETELTIADIKRLELSGELGEK